MEESTLAEEARDKYELAESRYLEYVRQHPSPEFAEIASSVYKAADLWYERTRTLLGSLRVDISADPILLDNADRFTELTESLREFWYDLANAHKGLLDGD